MRESSISVSMLLIVAVTVGGACGSDNEPEPAPTGGSGSPEQTGSSCQVVEDCFPNVDGGLSGEAMCLDRVRDGYCTHLCEADDDCCAAAGECHTDLRQVCSPFESKGQKMCFLGCEESDRRIEDGGAATIEEQEYCQRMASHDFICRSSGGGAQNRKVCVPGDCGVGAGCVGDADCHAGLTCLTGLRGGYCGKADCSVAADCPTGSQCVSHTDGQNYCFRTCAADTDCSFCRAWDLRATCASDVAFAETGTTGKVCVPPGP